MKNLQKIIEYGLYILVFLLPLQTRYFLREFTLGGWSYEYGNISVYVTDILLIGLLILFLIFILSLRIRQSAEEKSLQGDQCVDDDRSEKKPRRDLSLTFEMTKKLKVKCQKLNVFWFIIAILELSIFISIFVSIDKWAGIYGYVRFLLGIGLFSLIIYASYNKTKLIYSFVGGVFLQACLGIWQFLSQSTFASKWLGLAVHHGDDLGASIIETLDGQRWLRAYGGLDHPNIFGGLLVVAILLVILNSPFCKGGAPIGVGDLNRDYKFKRFIYFLTFKTPPPFGVLPLQRGDCGSVDSKFKILVFYFVSCVLFVSLFFTFSRTAWAGLIVGLLVILIGYVFTHPALRAPLSIGELKKEEGQAPLSIGELKKSPLERSTAKRGGVLSLLKIITIFAVLAITFTVIYSNLVLSRLSKDTSPEIRSINERVSMYYISKKLISDHWLLGTGINNYGVTVEEEIRQNAPYYFYQPVHNVFLLIWSEVGIIGLLAFICLIGYVVYLSWTSNVKGQMLNVIIAILAMFLLDHWWWSLHFGVFLFWFVMGLIIRELVVKNLE